MVCVERGWAVSWHSWTPEDAAGQLGCAVLGLLGLGAWAAVAWLLGAW